MKKREAVWFCERSAVKGVERERERERLHGTVREVQGQRELCSKRERHAVKVIKTVVHFGVARNGQKKREWCIERD